MTTNPNNHPRASRHDGVFESERAGRTPPVEHNSGHIRTTPAGGEVSRDQYQRPLPQRQGGPRRDE